MFNTLEEKLSETIIGLLAKEANLTAPQLLQEVKRQGKIFGLRAMYKELKNLQRQGVVVHFRRRYSLLIPWTLDFLKVAESMSDTYLESVALASLPKVGQKLSYRFDNLYSLNDFWSQLITFVITRSNKKVIYGWAPHNWYNLVKSDNEQQYIDSLRTAKVKQYLIIGGKTYLDKFAEKFWTKANVELSTAASPFHSQQSVYFDAIGSYVISLKLDHKMTAEIERLYQTTSSLDGMDLPAIISVFHQKTRAILTLEHNTAKARKIKGRFSRYFGIKSY